MLKKLLQFSGVIDQPEARGLALKRSLLRKEAKIGGQLFGPSSPGGRREFFCLDETTWIWHEEWQDTGGSLQSRTTRYDVRPNGVVKAQDGRNYQKISAHEAKRFRSAVVTYKNRVINELYSPVV